MHVLLWTVEIIMGISAYGFHVCGCVNVKKSKLLGLHIWVICPVMGSLYITYRGRKEDTCVASVSAEWWVLWFIILY